MFRLKFAEVNNTIRETIYDDIRQIIKDGISDKIKFDRTSTFSFGDKTSIYVPFSIGEYNQWGFVDCGVHVVLIKGQKTEDAFLEAKDYRSRLGDSEEMVFEIKDGISYNEFKKELSKAVEKLDNYIYDRRK